jgi:hypothetical protein
LLNRCRLRSCKPILKSSLPKSRINSRCDIAEWWRHAMVNDYSAPCHGLQLHLGIAGKATDTFVDCSLYQPNEWRVGAKLSSLKLCLWFAAGEPSINDIRGYVAGSQSILQTYRAHPQPDSWSSIPKKCSFLDFRGRWERTRESGASDLRASVRGSSRGRCFQAIFELP